MKPLLFAVTFIASLATAAAAAAAESRPNVLFILTDDQGWGDARFAGHPYVKTPNLDRLAKEGTWFKQFYVAATVCSPSRTSFMTSHYPSRHLIHGHLADVAENEARSMPNWLDAEVTTLPDLLKSEGYATGHFGKWHLGQGPGAPAPADYGFDVSKIVTGNGPTYEEERGKPGFWARSTQLFVDDTIAFIREHRDQPFYVNLWTLIPHAKLDPSPEQLAVYADLKPKADDPAFGPWMQKYLAKAKDLESQMKVFCASLTDLDTQIGRLLDTLDEMGLAENTIVVLSSDNGPEDYRIGNASNAGVGSPGPLRGRKRSMYEGGIRTFGLVRWPGKVPAGRVDETSVVGAVDFLPTIAALAGVAVPDSVKPDGQDLSPLWLGGGPIPREKPLHWEWLFNVQGSEDGYVPPALAIRDGDWKLFLGHRGGSPQLYHIPEDPGEHTDLAAKQPEVVKSLTGKALAWVKTLPPSPARDTFAASGSPLDSRGKAVAKAKGAGTASAKPMLDRKAIFKQKDTNGDARMTLEEYLHRFPDEQEGRRRFPTFDENQDGSLSEEEFVTMGKARQ
jgi:N-acetylgalactosamine-6-sulfatase